MDEMIYKVDEMIYKKELQINTSLAAGINTLLRVVPHQLTFAFVRVLLLLVVLLIVTCFLDKNLLSLFSLSALMNLLKASCSFFVKGLLLTTKSTPSGSLISPIALFFKIFIN
ncbi:MAG: hypothetical protein JSS73_10195 [Bacteroidetes bacterium]|nr:hypothetical protein [Bacteroidota bacterium]